MGCLLYGLAIFCPPLVPLFLGYGLKHTFWNIILTSLLWVPGVIHACILVWGELTYPNSPRIGLYIGHDINE